MLEPVATAGLAITLAYLALDRFRYRAVVERQANNLKAEVGEALAREKILDASNELRWFCREECNGHSPSGTSANLYNVLFRRSFDITLITLASFVCFFTLALGVGRELGTLENFAFLENKGWIMTLYCICVASSVAPVILIILGRMSVSWGADRTVHLKTQLEQFLSLQASQAKGVT